MGSTSNTEKFYLFPKFFETAYFLSKTVISSLQIQSYYAWIPAGLSDPTGLKNYAAKSFLL